MKTGWAPTGPAVTRGQVERKDAPLYTRQSGSKIRERVRWGCTSTAAGCPDGSSATNPCVRACFNVIARARAISTTGDPFRSPTSFWENVPGARPTGLDGWARKSAALPGTSNGVPRVKAYVRDTNSDGIVTTCSPAGPSGAQLIPRPRRAGETDQSYAAELSRLSERSNVGQEPLRRWELGGWKNGATGGGNHPNLRYTASFVFFNGWEGGRGPFDCEPDQVKFGLSTETYSTYAKYWYGD